MPLLLAELARADIHFSPVRRAVIHFVQLYHQREPRNLVAAVRHYLDRDHNALHRALADAHATAAVLDAQLARYPDLPRDVTELHRHLTEVDLAGRLRRDGGRIVLAFGKYAGVPLEEVAGADPDCLRWLLTQDFLPDFQALLRQALGDG